MRMREFNKLLEEAQEVLYTRSAQSMQDVWNVAMETCAVMIEEDMYQSRSIIQKSVWENDVAQAIRNLKKVRNDEEE